MSAWLLLDNRHWCHAEDCMRPFRFRDGVLRCEICRSPLVELSAEPVVPKPRRTMTDSFGGDYPRRSA